MNTLFCIESTHDGPLLCYRELHRAIAEAKRMEAHGDSVRIFEANCTLRDLGIMKERA